MKPTARKSLNLTNTERSQLHRFKLYRDSVLHVKQKEKDRIRKAAKRLAEDSKRSSLQKRKCKFEERHCGKIILGKKEVRKI